MPHLQELSKFDFQSQLGKHSCIFHTEINRNIYLVLKFQSLAFIFTFKRQKAIAKIYKENHKIYQDICMVYESILRPSIGKQWKIFDLRGKKRKE